VIEEWTEQMDAQGGRRVEVRALFATAKNPRKFEEGDTELVELEIDHAADAKIHKSYGGVGGGGLWKLQAEAHYFQCRSFY
jgi:hypothetical protein